jgi:hypothetical protein
MKPNKRPYFAPPDSAAQLPQLVQSFEESTNKLTQRQEEQNKFQRGQQQ